MDLDARKETIRRLALGRRSGMSPVERAARGAAVTERLLALPEVEEADPVLAFVSISSEVPTGMLLEAILHAGKTLLLPFVADDGMLRAARVSSLDQLTPGFRGIPEPRARMPVDAAAAAVIVVPGVAFDAEGGRLGYGGGFYDVFLSAAPERLRIGICFDFQLVERVPVAAHDQRVDLVVTDERVVRCSSRAKQ